MTRLVIDPTTTIDDFIVLNHDNSTSNNQNLSPSSLLAPSSLSQELLKQQRKKKSSNQESSSEVGIIPTYQNLNESLGEGAFNASELFSKFPSSPLAKKYYKIVDSLTPPELLMKFAATAPKPVQEAAKTTIMNFLGSLPNYALDAALVTTSVRLANLLYQMQITGYMLKNAEYVMSLTKSLKGLPKLPPNVRLDLGNASLNPLDAKTEITGEVQVKTSTGEMITVDVQQLTTALSKEIQALRDELYHLKNDREAELKSNLLTYIQALPEKELVKLTEDMSEEVLQTIQLVVATVMQKLGIDPVGPEMIIQQNIAQLAQLCMWQLITGYKLRELEALDKGVPIA
eukprot:gene9575-10396_t